MGREGPALGCRTSELEVGTEFSYDQGFTWLVVRTEPKYVDDADPSCVELRFMASPAESTGLSAWREVKLDDTCWVILERGWGSAVKSGSDLG